MTLLPWPLQLTQGTAAVRLCPAGSIDPLRLLERSGLQSEHELEFVTRGEPGAIGPYAVIRIRSQEGRPLLALEAVRLRLDVTALPPAAGRLVRARPETPLPGERGLLRARVALAAGTRSVLGRIREELRAPELIAWIEAGWPAGEGLSHRYYLDRGGTPWMVREESGRRTLYEGEVSPEAAPHLIPRAERPARR